MWRVQQVASRTSAKIGESGLNILNMDAQEETSRIMIVVEDAEENIQKAIMAIHDQNYLKNEILFNIMMALDLFHQKRHYGFVLGLNYLDLVRRYPKHAIINRTNSVFNSSLYSLNRSSIHTSIQFLHKLSIPFEIFLICENIW